jgi:hypothetical protein
VPRSKRRRPARDAAQRQPLGSWSGGWRPAHALWRVRSLGAVVLVERGWGSGVPMFVVLYRGVRGRRCTDSREVARRSRCSGPRRWWFRQRAPRGGGCVVAQADAAEPGRHPLRIESGTRCSLASVGAVPEGAHRPGHQGLRR